MRPDPPKLPALLAALALVLVILLDRCAIGELLVALEQCQQRALCAKVSDG
jgi:hypothetical protein